MRPLSACLGALLLVFLATLPVVLSETVAAPDVLPTQNSSLNRDAPQIPSCWLAKKESGSIPLPWQNLGVKLPMFSTYIFILYLSSS